MILAGDSMITGEQLYLFRHALMREAAYQLQVPSDRVDLHRIAYSIQYEVLDGDDLSYTQGEMAKHAYAIFKETNERNWRDRAVAHYLGHAEQAQRVFATGTAIQNFETVLDLTQEGLPALKARIALGRLYCQSGRFIEGNKMFQEATIDAQVLGENEMLARTILSYCKVLLNIRKHDEVPELLEVALDAAKHVDDPYLQHHLDTIEARLRWNDGDFEYADQFFSSLPIDDSHEMLELYGNHAALKFDMGDYASVVRICRDIIDNHPDFVHGPSGVVQYMNLGGAISHSDIDGDPVPILIQGLELAERFGMKRHCGVLYKSIGYAMKDKAKREEYLAKALRLAEEIGDDEAIAIGYIHRATQAVEKQDRATVIRYCKIALAHVSRIQSNNVSMFVNRIVGQTFTDAGDYEFADTYLTKAEEIAEHYHKKDQVIWVHANRCMWCLATGDFDRARQCVANINAIQSGDFQEDSNAMFKDIVRFGREHKIDPKIVLDVLQGT